MLYFSRVGENTVMKLIRSFFRTSEKGEEKKYTQSGLLLLFCRIIILGITISYILKAFSPVYYHEIDSYVLPTVAMEYRHSLIITQEDIDRAKVDFPEYYEKVDGFDSLRSSGLVKITDDKWLAFYFPSYSMFCIPLKLLLQALGADQIWAFTATNALFVVAALIYLYRRLKVPPVFKLLSVLLFVVSPIEMYIHYISAEAVMFSLIAISLVMYSNEKYRLSALLLSVAGMTNPTVMGIGIVMVAVYLVKMFLNRKNVKIFSGKNVLGTIKYACCYIPCLVPFIFNAVCIGTGNPTSGGTTLADYGERVLTYLFDVNTGFFSFAPLTLIVFLVLVVISLIKKDLSALIYAGFLIAPVLAYSLMIYINCVPVFCARYVMWTYPALIIGTSVLGGKMIHRDAVKYAVSGSLAAAAAAMVTINYIPMYYYGFNGMTRFLLDNIPAAYNPYRAMFCAETDKISWPFSVETPCFYFSGKDGTLRKLLFKSTDDYKNEVVSAVKGSGESLERFSELVNSVPSDGDFHYVNVSPSSGIKLWKKTSEDFGLIQECGTVLEVTDSFTAGKQSITFGVDIAPSGRYGLYKLEIIFAEGMAPSIDDSFYVMFLNDSYVREQLSFTGDDTMELIFAANEAELSLPCSLEIYSKESRTIESLSLKAMENIASVQLTQAPFEFTGDSDGSEGGVLIPAPLEPMRNYFLDIGVSGIDDNDEVYCMVYYQKRFNQIQPSYQLISGDNRILINSGDTTIVQDHPNDGIYIKFFGKTDSPVVIDHVTLSPAD